RRVRRIQPPIAVLEQASHVRRNTRIRQCIKRTLVLNIPQIQRVRGVQVDNRSVGNNRADAVFAAATMEGHQFHERSSLLQRSICLPATRVIANSIVETEVPQRIETVRAEAIKSR